MTNYILIRPPLNTYSIAVYDNVVNADQCRRLREYFDARPKMKQAETVNGKKRTFEEMMFDERVDFSEGLMKNVLRRVHVSIDRYFDEHIAEPNFRQQVKDGCYSLQPRMKKYKPGDEFPIHTDDASLLAMTRRFAYILYLNDDFEGGYTVFKSGTGEVARVHPKTGSMVVFPIHPVYMHEGEKIERGAKYVFNGFVNVITSQARVVSSDKPMSRVEVVNHEIGLLATELARVAGIVFSGK